MLKYLSLLLIFVLTGCASSQYKNHSYFGSRDIYPAVLYVFEEMHARVEKFNLKSNIFISSRIYNKKLNIKYNVKVLFKNNIIETSLINVKQPHAYHKTIWVPYKDFFPLNDDAIRQPIDAEIVSILNNSEKYSVIKNDILSELGFHYLVAGSMSKVNAKKWVAKNMSGRKFLLHLMNYDPEFRINDTYVATNKKYIAHFQYNSKKWVTTEFDLDLYTNNAYYEHMQLNSTITTMADLIDAQVQVYIVTFGFSFDQLLPEI